MRHFLLAAILCITFCSSALAQPAADMPATKEDVQRYFDVVKSRDMINKMVDAMLKPMHQMMHEEYLKNKNQLPGDFEERMNRRTDDMLKNMPWDEIFAAMVPAYQKHLTKGDINSLIAFYTSPTGQKLLNDMPEILTESMQSMMPIMRKYIDSMQDQLQQETADMINKSAKKPAPTVKN